GCSSEWELSSKLLPNLRQQEMVREAKLQDRARCEQTESVSRMYAEASKSVAEPRVSATHAAYKLKTVFRAERQEAERLFWRQELK
ncbi:unnamed protein product, partial [Ectocarpus fasciculatus]